MAAALEANEIRFPKEWAEDKENGVVVFNKGEAGPSYAVRSVPSEQGPKLELLTKQTDENTGEVRWMPSKTPCLDFPERVIREVEFRQARIDKSWPLDRTSGVLLHKEGIFAARHIEGSNGKLELLKKQKDEKGNPKWVTPKKPCVGTPETVFREATRRLVRLGLIREGKIMVPPVFSPDLKRDAEGKLCAVHVGGNFAVRQAGGGKLELLTSQYDQKTDNWQWKPAEQPFKAEPEKMYVEISRREDGIKMAKQGQVAPEKPVEKAQQQTKRQTRSAAKGKGREM